MSRENENFNIGRHGLKESENFVQHVVHPQRAPNDLPPPLRGDAPMSQTPHDAGFRQPVKIAPSTARPANDMPPGLLPASGCLNAEPHVYGGDPKQPNTYGKVPHR